MRRYVVGAVVLIAICGGTALVQSRGPHVEAARPVVERLRELRRAGEKREFAALVLSLLNDPSIDEACLREAIEDARSVEAPEEAALSLALGMRLNAAGRVTEALDS